MSAAGNCLRWIVTVVMVSNGTLRADDQVPITSLALTPDGEHVLLGSQRGIEIRDWPSMKLDGQVATDLELVHDLSFSADGKWLLAAGGTPAVAGIVEVIDWPSRDCKLRVAGHRDVVYRTAWAPDGEHWVSAGGDGICRNVDARSGNLRWQYAGHSRPVMAVIFLQDGIHVASAGVDQTLRLWNVADQLHRRTMDNHVGTVNDIAMRPSMGSNGELPIVATASDDRTVRFWQPTMGRLMRFVRLPSAPRSLAWSPDGTQLYAGCNDGRVRVVDPITAEVVAEYPGLRSRIHAVLYIPAAQRLLVAGESGFQVIDFQR